jgi:tRNA (cytidine/uridine-2'-O-)-methyltransferase
MATMGQGLTSAFRLGSFRPFDRLGMRYFSPMRIALYKPDIPQNAGTILRLAACLGAEAHIIEPAGFPVTDRAFRRAGMDYLDQVTLVRHPDWDAFDGWRKRMQGLGEGARLILFTTRSSVSYLDHAFHRDDVLMFGRESAGVPDRVHDAADARLIIPIRPGLRSLNVAVACAMALGEAMRQTRET